MSGEAWVPAEEAEAAAIVRGAKGRGAIDFAGAGTRMGFGRPAEGRGVLSTARLTGIVFHEPAEMTLRAKAGTPLRDVEASLAAHNQILPFEPMDPRPVFGTSGEPTVGGLIATGLSGPRRIAAGAVRDSLIGLKFVNGAGEILSSGGRVTKNVTGLDLVKLQCGALGTLGLILEATFKLLPRPETEATVLARRLDDVQAVAMMTRALGSSYSITGAAHLHEGMGREFPRTFLRIEGFADSVNYRAEKLTELLADFGVRHVLEAEDSRKLWRAIRDADFVAEPREHALWRVSLAPSESPAYLKQLGDVAKASLLDWGGGLVTLATDPTEAAAVAVRAALRGFKGHATLLRGPEALRAAVDVFEPQGSGLLRLTRGVKASLDPQGLFNAGRMYAGV